ncbi:ASCH domain-containing protein [Macrococcoides canis]|uniref:ASCH domain-containing protein n=1 Tax=Macrococcoides canis TaxID=1855823 RepID=UPI0010FBC4B9|nr:ASCH domain-containing protein [Macrococcus canis]QCT74010.1 ASCH domain-containing protein [Macrococcus canis]
MNIKAEKFLNQYLKDTGSDKASKVAAWQFGVDPDILAHLVITGKKTATCSLYKLYALDGEALPEVGQLDVVLDSTDSPVAIIKNKSVEIKKMNEVDESFAIAEGEGDCSYQYWWDEHVKFFSDIVKEYDETFTTDDLLVCERFEVVYPK